MELIPVYTQDGKKVHLSMLGARTICDQRVFSKPAKTAKVTCPRCKKGSRGRSA